MKKLIVALLVAALCMVAPAIAFEWGEDLGTESVLITYPYMHTYDTYFDVIIGDEEQTTYAGWCADPNTNSIRNEPYEATLTNISGVNEQWNKVNWILNNKGDASYQDIQKAIWDILSLQVPGNTIIAGQWDDAVVAQLVQDADPEFVPTCGMIWGILVTPIDRVGQAAIIEAKMPACPPPVPEFPTMMIPVFLVGSLMVATSVLKKE